MEQLLLAGENMEFFVEGGRSRTGKALQPKGGLLSIVIDSLTNGYTFICICKWILPKYSVELSQLFHIKKNCTQVFY